MDRNLSKEIAFGLSTRACLLQQVNLSCLESIQNFGEYFFEEEKIIVVSVEKIGSREYKKWHVL